MTTKPYPTDLTDAEWDLIKDLIPPPKPGGRHRELDMRAVVDALFYVVDGGIKWRMLPHEYPKWPSVYWYFSQWRDSGTWQRMHDTLRARVRQEEGRHKHPTAGCLDSQSVKTTELGGERGYDSGKKGCSPVNTLKKANPPTIVRLPHHTHRRIGLCEPPKIGANRAPIPSAFIIAECSRAT